MRDYKHVTKVKIIVQAADESIESFETRLQTELDRINGLESNNSGALFIPTAKNNGIITGFIQWFEMEKLPDQHPKKKEE